MNTFASIIGHEQLHAARAVMSQEHIGNMIRFGELSPRLERSDVFPEGITVKWIDDHGNVTAQWLCQNAHALYKQLHTTFGTSYAVAFLNIYRWEIKRPSLAYCFVADAVDLDRWNDDGGFAW